MALAVLARDWAGRRDGSVLALVVDHGLRPASADEARLTVERLAALGIPARLLPLANLTRGSALAERARIMRYEILAGACRDAGILHLLLGHQAADQVETLAMRVLRGSLTHGLACMPVLRETAGVRLLRPLLRVQPAVLRELLTTIGVDWVEDPSNQDMRALRPRLRGRLADGAQGDTGLPEAISAAGRMRSREEVATAAELASRTTIRPEGFALLSPGRIGPAALGSLVRTIGGSAYDPSPARINELAARPGPATVAGVRIIPAGRFGDGLLIVREEAAVMRPIPVAPNALWDNRFRVVGTSALLGGMPSGATIGKLGADAARFRGASNLPSAALRTLPAVRVGNFLALVPHLRYAADGDDARMMIVFSPPGPLAGPSFVSAA
jgi:tRNA(Ile)-lysidine synthase